MLLADVSYTKLNKREAVEDYARVLYENYRARILASSSSITLVSWDNASPLVRREFMRDAQIELGY